MSKEDIRHKLAALQSRLATNKAIILADPEPYIEKIHRILCDYQKVIAEIERAVSPDVIFDRSFEMGIPPRDFRGGERVQVEAVKKALEEDE
jgi:hypothetical protein